MRAPSCSTPPTRSTACAAARRTSTPPRTSGTSAISAVRTATTRGRRSTSPRGRSRCAGSTAPRSRSRRPSGEARVELALPGLYNVYNAVAAASLALALEVPLAGGHRRAGTVLGSLRALRAHRDRGPAAPHAADQESGRGKRSRTDDRRRGCAARRRDRAQRRHCRRPRRLVDLGRRLRAARRRSRAADRDRLACGGAGAQVRLRRPGSGADRGRAVARGRARPGAGADARGRRADRPPHVHGDARAATDRRRPWARRGLLGGGAA